MAVVAGISLTGILVLMFVSVGVMQSMFPAIEERGQFGDSFGAIAALFSGLAFGGVILAVAAQAREFHDAETERSAMLKEVAAQTRVAVDELRAHALAQLILLERAASAECEGDLEKTQIMARVEVLEKRLRAVLAELCDSAVDD